MRPPLRLRAGATALARIRADGLTPDAFDLVPGASGGPKWLVLSGLDRALFAHWFPRRRRPLDLVGSSIGAWRLACLAQADPGAAIERFVAAYAEPEPAVPDRDAMTAWFESFLDRILGPTGADEVATGEQRRLHVVTCRERGGSGRESWRTTVRLAVAAGGNALDRKFLDATLERVLLGNGDGARWFLDDRLGTIQVALSGAAVRPALLATAAVPRLVRPVLSIPGAGPGPFHDGGILDYHFRPPFGDAELVFYPHFYPDLTPGWFDKPLRRRARPEALDRVLLVHPDPAFVASLPGGRIPDRRDIGRMPDPERRAAWLAVIDASRRLGDAFLEWDARGHLEAHVEPL